MACVGASLDADAASVGATVVFTRLGSFTGNPGCTQPCQSTKTLNIDVILPICRVRFAVVRTVRAPAPRLHRVACRGDVLDLASVQAAAEGCAWVFHAAAVFAYAGHSAEAQTDLAVRGTRHVLQAARQAISSPLLEAAIDGARGILLNITGPSSMGPFEMNAAAEIIHGVAHQDANIIFGTVIDDEMGDEVKVTVIAAGFERWDAGPAAAPAGRGGAKVDEARAPSSIKDLFGEEEAEDPLDGDDDFDVPSFLR